MIEQWGTCEFCGKQKYIDAETKTSANNEVAFSCDCYEGAVWRDKEERKRNRNEVLEEFKNQVEKIRTSFANNYKIEMTDEIVTNIMQVAAKIYDGEYEATAFRRGRCIYKLNCTDKKDLVLNVKITLTAKCEA